MGNSWTATNNPQNLFFKNSSYSGAYVRKLYEKTKGQIHWENRQNIPVKEIHFPRRYKCEIYLAFGNHY